jgi:hypothetical protein
MADAVARGLAPILLFVQHTVASTFTPNCPLPPENTNFVSGPDTRGTLSILWNCLSIIILCTWSIQHLNIPAQRPILPEETPWFTKTWKMIWWTVLDSRTQLKWTILTVFLPEYIMGKALSDRVAAVWARDKLQDFAIGDREPFGLVHSYFANMGGYCLDFRSLFSAQSDSEGPNAERESRPLLIMTTKGT